MARTAASRLGSWSGSEWVSVFFWARHDQARPVLLWCPYTCLAHSGYDGKGQWVRKEHKVCSDIRQCKYVQFANLHALQMKYCIEAIDDIKYSPDGTKLAAASHDNFIDIFSVKKK